MKKTVLVAVFCAAVLLPAEATWSYKYWYQPEHISWSECTVYFQIAKQEVRYNGKRIYIGGEGQVPNSTKNNDQLRFRAIALWSAVPPIPMDSYIYTLPWRNKGDKSKNDVVRYTPTFFTQGGENEKYIYLIIEEGIINVGNYWFEGMGYLTDVQLPSTLQYIGEGAFQNCGSLERIILPEALWGIGNRAFKDCTKLIGINIQKNTALYDEVFENSPLENIFFHGPSLLYGRYIFKGCTKINSLSLKNNSVIGDYALAESSLGDITIGENTTVGEYSFYNCTSLSSVIFKGKIDAIKDGMFQNCSSLKSFNIPDGVTSIGDYAFCGAGIDTLDLPNSIMSIGANAFDASGITSINIPNSVTSIGEFAFNNTKKLTSVTIPNSVTKIGERAFKQSGLTSITVSGSVKDLPYAMCSWCGNLTSVKLGEGVKIIGPCAFQDGWNLETVSLPASLESIEEWAFTRCNNLKVIECNGMIPPAKMNPDAFAESDLTETSLCVHRESIEAYKNAPVWKNFKNIGTYPAGIYIINGENFTVNSGSKVQLTAKLTPHDAVPGITWTSSNTSIASVVNGTVTAYAEGEAVITATTFNEIFKDECRITVKK